MTQVVVLDRNDVAVLRAGDGPQMFLKACPRCDLLVEHIRVTTDFRAHARPLSGGTPLRYEQARCHGAAPYRYITAQAHRDRCVPARAQERKNGVA